MEPVRPLRDVFDDLANRPGAGPAGPDPAGSVAGAGHPDLPDDLVAEALVSYAATAPPQVAEQLGPFVTAHSGVPALDDDAPAGLPDPADGLALLDGAGTVEAWNDPLDLDAADDLDLDPPDLDGPDLDGPDLDGADLTPDLDPALPHHPQAWADHGFGTGAADGPEQHDVDDDLPDHLGPAGDLVTDGWLTLDLPADEPVTADVDALDPAGGTDGGPDGVGDRELDGHHDPVDLDDPGDLDG